MNEDIEVQTTFLSYRELFEHSAKRCRDAGSALSRQLDSMNEPYSYGLEKIIDDESELAGMLSTYADHGPEEILNTYFQYMLDTQSRPPPSSPQEALQFLSLVNEEVAEQFLDQAGKTAPEDIRDALDAVAGEIIAYNRRISMVRVTLYDI